MLQNNNEAEWIRKIRKSDSKVFENLVDKYFESLYKFAWRYVRDRHTAENIAQDVFINTWANRKKLDPSLNIKSYLYQAAKNLSLNYLRAEKNNSLCLDNVSIKEYSPKNPEEEYLEKDRSSLISSAIENLPEKCRIVFIMKKYDELSYTEIAEILNISAKTVENQVGRAFKILRKSLSEILIV
ncbi:RNA polymerase sigma factor [candidate division KSB1 bacterium]